MRESPFANPTTLPKPFSPDAAAHGITAWHELAARSDDPAAAQFLAAFADDRAGRMFLESVFGNSPFLTHCLLFEPGFTHDLLAQGADATFARAVAEAAAPTATPLNEDALKQRLRIAKRRIALVTGLADIAGLWPLERVTRALSDFADLALSRAVTLLLARAHAAGEIALPLPDEPARDSGVIVLGLGKLGARELNYSSDIDLMILYDPDRVLYRGKDSLQQLFVRFARDLVRLLEERTADGYVFRTDLRLRPDPGATPLALSVQAAENYYESTGQNWERAAMIKARCSAGDIEAGRAFIDVLRPFVWRRSLDFAAIQDIHSIKRQIHAHKGGGHIAVAGHNVKLGRGGIREIEFFVQTQQLIWGGRLPALRAPATLDGLRALTIADRVSVETERDMAKAYRFLRMVEHRLQMVDDRQTHALPVTESGLAHIAQFLGFADGASFAAALVAELRAVETHYAQLFEEAPDLSGPGNLVFTGTEDDPDTLTTLANLGFREPKTVAAVIRAWHHGRYRAMRSTRAKELLTELMPTLLQEFGKTVDPDQALVKFDEFLSRLPAGVQLFSLFYTNPSLLELVAEIMGSAPRLADWLAHSPQLLDGVLTGGFFAPPPDRRALAHSATEALTQARDFQDTLDFLRRWNNDRVFQIGIHILRDLMDAGAAAEALTDTADTALEMLLGAVEAEFAKAHGRFAAGGLAVVALGKLGSRELTVGSDLDLLFVYDVGEAEASDGARPLAPSHYFARLAQRYINAITAPTGEGKLYEVDMRLRPSGSAGSVAVSLEALLRYHRSDAWTWEHMALTRARVVCGPPALAMRIMAAIVEALDRPRDPATLVADVYDMRLRIEREHRAANLWDAKYVRGGLVDVEFLAQYLQLRHGHTHPGMLSTNTAIALARLGAASFIPARAADDLIAAVTLWRKVQSLLRLTFGPGFEEEKAPGALKALLARTIGVVDFAAARAKLAATAAAALGWFEELIERPALATARSKVDDNKIDQEERG